MKFNLAAAPPSAHKEDCLQSAPKASVNEVTGWRWLLLWLLAAMLRLWSRTLRFEADAATRERLAKSDVPAALVIWHNRLFISAEYFRRYRNRRRVYALVSASKDGAWLAAFYRMIGIHPVRGSSSNFGREAGRALIEVMREGHDIGITPDGPRGPMYVVEPGVLVVTRRNQAPMVLIGAEFTHAWRLKSWDRFYIPLPFSRVRLSCTIMPSVTEAGEKTTAEDVRAALMAISPDPA
jgi:lysophospholipid acyltransferase (LPLAT)-like uncharacterized protein